MAGRRSRQRISAAAALAAAQRRRRNMFWMGGGAGAVIIVLVVIVALSINSGSSSSAATASNFPNFDFKLYQGEGVLGAEDLELAQLQGRPIVLNFWAGLCPPCRAEMPGFQRFYDDNKDDVILLGIDVGRFTGLGNKRDARNLLQELGVSYPAGYTNDRSAVRDYSVLTMPTTVFINSSGEVVQNWSGALDEATLRALVGALLIEENETS